MNIHERLYNDISGSIESRFNSNPSYQIIPKLTLTNSLNPTKLTISQINNIYIRLRQSQLEIPTITFTGTGELTQSMVNTQITASGLASNQYFHVEFANTITSIGTNAFHSIPNVYSVAISQYITTIGFYAFYNLTHRSLRYLSFHPDSICTTFLRSAFDGNSL